MDSIFSNRWRNPGPRLKLPRGHILRDRIVIDFVAVDERDVDLVGFFLLVTTGHLGFSHQTTGE